LYASRTRAKWLEINHVAMPAPAGWKENNLDNSDTQEGIPDAHGCANAAAHMDVLMSAGTGMCKSRPLICSKYQSEMRSAL